MAEAIQFNCPACATLLRVPLAMAAKEGPCPVCQREIIGPDPATGIAAHEVIVDPVWRFHDFPPVVPLGGDAEEAAPLPRLLPEILIPDEPEQVSPPRSKSALLLPCAFSVVAGLAVGFAVGVRSTRDPVKMAAAAPLTPPVQAVEKPVAAENPAPVPEPIAAPVPEKISAPVVEKIEEPAKISAAAEASLRAFLGAPDWAARSAHALSADRVREAMAAYSREVPDGPTPYQSVSLKQGEVDEASGNTMFIFLVVTEHFPSGIPVAVVETPQGWLVDWEAFVEFRDDRFKKFADGPADRIGRFQLIVSAPPAARAANTENEHFVSFLLDPPFPGRQKLAFVKRDSEACTIFQSATANGQIFTPVLEVAKRTTPDGKSYLEILKVLAPDWRPRP
jgi:hypothetical protein